MDFKMKKYIFIISVLICTINLGFSQESNSEQDTDSFYEVSLSYAKPLGEYKFQLNEENNVGYALPGLNISLSAKNYISSYFGFKYNANILLNSVDKSFYYLQANGQSTTLKLGMWKNLNISLGPIFHTNYMKNSTYFEISAMVGINSVNRPKVVYTTLENGQVNSANTIKNGFGIGFSVIPEIAMHTKISKRSYLKIFINYFLAPSYIEYKSQYLFYKEFEGELIPVYVVNSYEENLIISAFNLGVGISF